jgi:hypothetical protein
MQPSVYDSILPKILLTLTVSTEPVASFFISSRLTRSSRRTYTSGTTCRTCVPKMVTRSRSLRPRCKPFLRAHCVVRSEANQSEGGIVPQQIEEYSLLRTRMQGWTEVGTPALQRLHQSIRIVSHIKAHVCKSLIGYAKPPVGEVGGNRQRHRPCRAFAKP